jgi:hypothetical protein
MKPNNYSVAILLAAILPVFALYVHSPLPTTATAAENLAVNELSADIYSRHVAFLASDELKGRGNGSPELERAGDYIEAQFRMFGLKPVGDNGGYSQKFQITTGAELGSKNILQVDGVSFKPNADFVTIPFSPTSDVDGAAVFAGYGITAPELQWDDYQGINANGKIVVVFRHEPQELDANSKFAGKNFTSHATFVNKAINAKRHGAKAIIFITDPNNHANEQDVVGAATRDSEGDDLGIPAMHATRAALKPLFAKLGRDLGEIQRKMDAELTPQSFALGDARVHVSTDVVRLRKSVRNIVGAIQGTDPQLNKEWVVVGAHYDHLGLGDRNSLAQSQIGQIHHGADDNASGSAGVLELARLAARNKSMFKRSVLFMTFAGEELGLFGSNYFVNHPTMPLESIVGMVNMDMIGRMTSNKLTVLGAGTAPEFKPWLEELNKSVNLNLSLSDGGEVGGSDHMSFNSKHIPNLFFFTGLHADYHRPSDTADKINAKGAVQVLTLAAMITQRLANAETRPQYTEVRQQHPQTSGNSSGSGYGPYFGSVPDFRDDLNGVLFADVRPDSPAGKAGLKAGDLLVQFDGQPIKNLYDFTYALGTKKPGDVVPVVVQRNNQSVKVNVTLEARK